MRMRCTLTGLAIAATAALAAPSAQAFNTWTPVPHSFFGMTLMHASDWPNVSIGAVGKGSCVDWPYVETSNGHYNWGTLDGYVNSALSHGVDLIYTFDGVPSWAASNKSACHPSSCSGIPICQSMPSDINTFKSYVTALVSRYRGRIKNYELWNEAWHEAFSVSNMVTLTSTEYSIIRSIDPGAKIITPALYAASSSAVSWAKSYFSSGGPRGVDIASIHAYPNPYSSSADQPEGINSNRYLLQGILPVLSQYLPGKPLWDTEGSWNLNNVGNYTSTSSQAGFIARWYLLHWSNGFARAYWYAWDSPTYGTMMPSMRGGSTTPATAYQQIQNWMYGRTMSSPCTMQSNGTTWVCALAGSNGYKGLVVWNTSGSTSYHPSSPSTYHQSRNLAGTVSYYAGSSGASVTIGTQPILLEN